MSDELRAGRNSKNNTAISQNLKQSCAKHCLTVVKENNLCKKKKNPQIFNTFSSS